MKKLLMPALLAVVTAMMVGSPLQLRAQNAGGGGGGGGGGRGNFNPEEMRARMMERYRETMEVKDDDAWKVIEPRIQKVLDARMEVGGGMRGMFGPRRGGAAGGDTAGAGGGAGDRPQRRGGFGQQSVAAQNLQKALDAKASTDEIKAKLVAYRDDRKTKQAALEQAQAKLKEVLNVKQEAAAVLGGLLE